MCCTFADVFRKDGVIGKSTAANKLRLAKKAFRKKEKKNNMCVNSLLLVEILNINFKITFHCGPNFLVL